MALLDVKISVRKSDKTSLVKILCKDEDSFRTTVEKSLKKYLQSEGEPYDDTAVVTILERVEIIECNKTKTRHSFNEWLGEPDIIVL